MFKAARFFQQASHVLYTTNVFTVRDPDDANQQQLLQGVGTMVHILASIEI